MSNQMTVLSMVLLIGVLVVMMFYIPRFLVKKAVQKVVAMFRKRGAISPETAITLEELGLVRGSYLERAFKFRDYRPHAVRMLGQARVLQATEEGRFYLSEEELRNSPVKKFAAIE